MAQQEFFIKSDNKASSAIETDKGYELWSNDRKMHVVIEKRTVFSPFNNTQRDFYTAACWVLSSEGWERGDNDTAVDSVEEYVRGIEMSPYFINAVNEFWEQNKNVSK